MTDPKPVVTMIESGRLSVDGDVVATVVYDPRGSPYIIPTEGSSLYPAELHAIADFLDQF